MATHFMRILSRMMVPGPARTPLWRGGRLAAGGRFASNSNPTRSHQSPPPTQDRQNLVEKAGNLV